MKYDKPSLSFEEQMKRLVDRGLVIDDPQEALHYLSHINYYRLGAYWFPFEESKQPHRFTEGTTFETVLNHYVFDRELRLHLLDAIEKIEVSFKTQWAYHISQAFGAYAYTLESSGIVKNVGRLRSALQELTVAVDRSDDRFIKHHKQKYDEQLPPAWVVCEVMSLGLLSRFYSNLRSYKVRREIASTYDFDEGFLEGFLEHLTYIRNICAHHSRLWNRHLSKKMPIPKGKPSGLSVNIYVDQTNKTEHKIYNTLVLIQYLTLKLSPETNWGNELIALIEKHEVSTVAMGFPDDWRQRDIWNIKK